MLNKDKDNKAKEMFKKYIDEDFKKNNFVLEDAKVCLIELISLHSSLQKKYESLKNFVIGIMIGGFLGIIIWRFFL